MFWILFALFVFPGLIGAAAGASGTANETGSSGGGIDGLSWMNVRDSSGVPLANYSFVTDHGGILDPAATVLWTLLGLEFTGYMVIVISAIWLIGYALSFQWLSLFSTALHGLARAFTQTVATPMMLITAATLGAFCVAWFALRGYHAKATTQVVTMLAVATLGPMFLADPLAEVLSPDGLLAQGRDLGISVAAGLNGDATPDPARLISTLQGKLADNFARSPLQVWNFGHVVDSAPACRSAWTTGVSAGDDGRVRKGLRECGDGTAAARADNPTMGQVGTGLILLICGTLLLLFAVFLAVRVIKAALDSIYQGFLTILGFAAGGFIYGPTQNFLVRSLVHGFVAAARMTLYVIFLSFYMVFIGNIFEQAQGHVMAVLVTAGLVEVIALSQLKHLSSSIGKGNDWIANRFALAVQNGVPRTASGGSGGGTALGMGMGTVRAGGSGGIGLIPKLAMLNTLNASPAAAWMAGGVVNPMNPLSRRRRKMDKENMAASPMSLETHEWNKSARDNWIHKAGLRSDGTNGPKTDLQVANILDGLYDSKAPDAMLIPAMLWAGATHQQVINAERALAAQKASMMVDPIGVPAVQKAVAATFGVHNHLRDGDPKSAIASQAVVAADNFARHALAPVNAVDDNDPFVRWVMQGASLDQLAAITPAQWRAAGVDKRLHIGNQLALRHQTLAHAYSEALHNPAATTAQIDRIRMEFVNSGFRISTLHTANQLSPWHHA
ncbi:hypothetical protein [Nocardia sp. NPDC056000]|uniref:hypothetical protein n=1 Tax=Nocardia sp. NPDC056000 TaxID=3345674 RepID=UPI0035DDE558